MFSKKLPAIVLTGIAVLIVIFVFATISFVTSSTLARSSQQNSPTLPPPIIREVYRVTAGGGDAVAVNVRDQNCTVIGTLKINTIVAIRETSNDNTIKCSNADGTEIELYRLSEDRGVTTGRYIAASNLSKREAKNAFNDENKAQVASPRGLRIRAEDCSLLHEKDKDIPKALRKRTIVTLPNPNNIEIKTCLIDDDGFFEFEMVKVNFEYKVGKETKTGTGYVAQEFLVPAKK